MPYDSRSKWRFSKKHKQILLFSVRQKLIFFFYIIYISFSTQAQKLKFLSFKNTPRQKLLSLHQPLKRQRERLVHCSIFMYPTGRCPSVPQLPSTGLPPHSRVLIQYILTTPLHLMDFPVLLENFPLKVYRIF